MNSMKLQIFDKTCATGTMSKKKLLHYEE